MTLRLRSLAAGMLTCGLGACASQSATPPSAGASEASPRSARAEDMAKAAKALRGSTRGDVLAALGPAARIPFESGYEVWVYQFVEPPPRKQAQQPDGACPLRDPAQADYPPSELVLLFTPSGIVTKVRVRSASC